MVTTRFCFIGFYTPQWLIFTRSIYQKKDIVRATMSVLSLIHICSDREGICLLDSATGEIVEYDTLHLPVSCHGTGDVYASVLFGCLTRGMSDYDSIRIAADTTVCAIRATIDDPDHWYGVRFEDAIPTRCV